MKYLKRYLKQLFSKENLGDEACYLGEAVSFLSIAVVGILLIVNEIGRHILFCLTILITFGMTVLFFVFSISEFYRILKNFKKTKKQWEIEELKKQKKVKNSCSYVPTYFLDLSALEHYSGAFYSDFLTENFSKSLIVPEENAILMTDENTLKRLKEMEDNPEEKMIYMGYTTFIRRHFKVIQTMENFNQDLTKLWEAKMPYLTFVTADEDMAKQITQNIPMQLKMISKENKIWKICKN